MDSGISINGADVPQQLDFTVPKLNLADLLGPDTTKQISALATASPGALPKMEQAATAGLATNLRSAAQQQMISKQQQVDLYNQNAQQDALVAQLKGQQQRDQELLIEKTAAGIVTPDEVVAAAAKLKTQDAQLDQELSGIRARQANGFFDNPAQWIYDQFALPSDMKAYNDGVQLRNATATNVDNLVALSTAEAKNIRDTNLNKTAEIVAAESKQAGIKALTLAAAANSELSTLSLDYQKVQRETMDKTVAQRTATISLAMQAQSLEYDRQRTESSLSLQEQTYRIQSYVEGDREAYKAAVDHTNDLFNTRETVETFNKLPESVRQARLAMAAANVNQLVMTPTQAYQNTKAAAIAFKNPQTAQLFSDMELDWNRRIEKEMTKSSQLTKEAQLAKVTDEFNKHWATVNKDIVTNTSPTGYRIPSYGAIAAGAGQQEGIDGKISDIPLYQDIIGLPAKTAATSQVAPTGDDLFKKTSALVDSGQLTATQAQQQLSLIGKAILGENYKNTNPTLISLPPQSSLRVQVDLSGMLGPLDRSYNSGKIVVDLADQTSIANALAVVKSMKQRAEKTIQQNIAPLSQVGD